MRRSFVAVAGFMCLMFVPLNALGDFFEVTDDQFTADSTVVDFETGSTGLPSVPGLSFLMEGIPSSPDWFAGSGNFDGFFGQQGWSNLVSTNFSNLGVAFDSPVQAFGGWFGQIPDFLNSNPPQIEVRAFDGNSDLLFSTIVDLNAEFEDPVWIGFGSNDLISRAEFRVSQFPEDGFFGVDNFTFGSVVPEPSSGLVCLLLLTAMCKRKRDRA